MRTSGPLALAKVGEHVGQLRHLRTLLRRRHASPQTSPRCTLSECGGGDGGGAVALQRSTVEEWKMWSGDRNRGSEGVRE